jgi:hypothetical protein
MFENIVDSWTEKESGILDKLYRSLRDGDYLNRIMILNSDLSDFTKNYILYEFNEESTSDELISKIEKANKLYFNYALRPKWTLQTFLFNNFESRPPNEILKKLNIFTFYNYYSDSIKEAIKDNFQIFITKTELTSIINSVNLSIYEKLSTDISSLKIKNFLIQLFLIRYEKESEYNLESKIPYSFVKIFLEDKSYTDFIQKFSVIKDLDSHTELSLKDITKVLTDKYNTSESPEKTESLDVSTESGKVIDDDKIEFNNTEPVKNEKDEKEIESIEISDTVPEIVIKPLNKIKNPAVETSGKEIETGKTEITKRDKKDSNVKIKDSNVSEPMKKINSDTIPKKETDIIDKKKKSEYTDADTIKTEKNPISVLFDEKRSAQILKKIYKSDLILMDMSFTKLKECRNWEEASALLKQVFKRNDVDIYNKDVVFFVDKLNEYFKNK